MDTRKKIIANDVLIAEVRTLLQEGRRVVLKVKGVSMLPFIVGDRDSVLLKQAADYTPGEIVLAEVRQGTYVLHRLLSIDGETPDANVVLMGDGNCMGTEKCRRKDILGKVVTIYFNGKEIDPNTPKQQRRARYWRRMLPIRRYLLAVLRRTGYTKKNRQTEQTNTQHH